MHQKILLKLQSTIDSYLDRTGHSGGVKILSERQGEDSVHVEIVGGYFEIVCTSRGGKIGRETKLSLYETTRWFLFDFAEMHAQSLELKNRKARGDALPLPNGLANDGYSRWNWMAEAIVIMNGFSVEFGSWALDYYTRILSEHPLEEHEKHNAKWPIPEVLV
jgi:hypothetical protein